MFQRALKKSAKQLCTGVIGMARGVAHQIQDLVWPQDQLFRIQSVLEQPPWLPYGYWYNIAMEHDP
jgi:hypothetical protein